MPENGGKDLTDASPAMAETKAGKRPASHRKQPIARSRVGNGKALLAGIDQRSLPYREYPLFSEASARSRRRERRRHPSRQDRRQGGDRPRARLPALHGVRAQEARHGGALL